MSKPKSTSSYNRAKKGFAKEKRELLKELHTVNYLLLSRSIILGKNQKDKDEYNRLKKREQEILNRLDEITV